MDIDFVLLWVDGEDPVWLKEKNKYAEHLLTQTEEDANGYCRYRSCDDLLRFWFRGIEKNAPWVRRVFFISCGQIPSWLNVNHPALVIVNHMDFIPKEYLPTFNCRPIQFNLHRIKDLSEHFVLFDDDTFLLNPVSPDTFYHDGLPLLQTYLGYLNKGTDCFNRVLWNDYGIVNSYFNIGNAIWNNRRKWFSIKKLGVTYALFNYFCYRVNKTLPVNTYGHLAYPHLKSTIRNVWDTIPEHAQHTCYRRFRADDQLSQQLFSAWNQVSGRFSPISIDCSPGKFFSITPETLQEICLSIERKDLPIICLNDSSNNTDAEHAQTMITDAFRKRFPNKSAFEK